MVMALAGLVSVSIAAQTSTPVKQLIADKGPALMESVNKQLNQKMMQIPQPKKLIQTSEKQADGETVPAAAADASGSDAPAVRSDGPQGGPQGGPQSGPQGGPQGGP